MKSQRKPVGESGPNVAPEVERVDVDHLKTVAQRVEELRTHGQKQCYDELVNANGQTNP